MTLIIEFPTIFIIVLEILVFFIVFDPGFPSVFLLYATGISFDVLNTDNLSFIMSIKTQKEGKKFSQAFNFADDTKNDFYSWAFLIF